MFKLLAVGADPEVFLLKDGAPMSSEGLIGGTKADPRPMEGLPPGYFIQEDNVAAEFNIPPAPTALKFSTSIAKALRYTQKIAAQQGLTVKIAAAMDFPREQLLTKHAMELGCEPDYDAWTGLVNEKPMPPFTMRTAAGHVHISWAAPDEKEKFLVGRACDVYLGIPSLLVTDKSERRELYGKAGAIRPKPYGVEYRTLDNFWIPNQKHRTHIFSNVQQMLLRMNRENAVFADFLWEWEEEIVECINNHDRDQAVRLMDVFQIQGFAVN